MAYVMLFDFRPLFSTYVDQPVRLLGLSPLTDQRLAGVVMMVEQIATSASPSSCSGGGAARAHRGARRRRRPPRLMRPPWSFTFEPLFVVLAAPRCWIYVRAWRREGGRAWELVAFTAGMLLIVAR